jgi:pimeloyl-ACP methyl ester carboxylesterase
MLRAMLFGMAAVAALYALVLALLWFGQERLLFQPERLPAEHRLATAPDIEERFIDVPGARLSALHLRLPSPDGVVFFLHGNAGSLAGWFANADFYRRANFDLFMIDYRGYGKSSGRIESEAQLHADARAAWQAIEALYRGKRRVVLGRSLGSGLAAALAADVQPEATVLVSPYVSMVALAAEHYRWVPSAVLRYPLRTDLVLPRVRGPVLLAHGSRDDLIPPTHSRRLATLQPRAQVLLVPEGGHNDLHQHAAYLDGLREFLRALPAPVQAPG